LQAIGYDAGERVLEVQFRRRGTYRYYGVPRETYEALMRSRRKGNYLNTHIRDVFVAVALDDG
jgi:hypothetical protein